MLTGLQNNQISTLAGLQNCTKLAKLFLGGNRLARIEGLQNCPLLEELHVSNQQLSEDEELTFCPESLASLSQSLMILDVSGNKKRHLRDVASLSMLQDANCKNNEVSELEVKSNPAQVLLASQWCY
jgi:protein phosphatase 1 regulatory subunit 42